MIEDKDKEQKVPSRREMGKLLNNTGWCPAGSCECPPADHRPIALSESHFCYGPDCMCVCTPLQNWRPDPAKERSFVLAKWRERRKQSGGRR